MRVLWFANSTLTNKKQGHGYNGCGWISSLQEELLKRDDVQFGLAMISNTTEKCVDNGIHYYRVNHHSKTIREKVCSGLRPKDMKFEKDHWRYYEQEFLKVIDDFKPDVIHIFGTEFYYGLIGSLTTVPVVIHIQGVLDACRNAYFPAQCSPLSYYFFDLNPKHIWSRFQIYAEWKRLCVREQEIYKRVNNYIGRTDFDKACVRVFNPKARYFFGEEILRKEFYNEPQRNTPLVCTISTTISAAMYKGFDNVLKAAKCLKAIMGDCFVWNVYGNVDPCFAEKLTGIRHEDVNVRLCGVISAEQLSEVLQNTTVYYHSSYIENSSNAVWEAEMSACPVVVNDVGGLSSIVHHGVHGYLVPANDPYQTAYRIYELHKNPLLALEMGKKGREWAIKRHNKEEIVSGLMMTYKDIIDKS